MTTIRPKSATWIILALLPLMIIGCQLGSEPQPAPRPLPPPTPTLEERRIQTPTDFGGNTRVVDGDIHVWHVPRCPPVPPATWVASDHSDRPALRVSPVPERGRFRQRLSRTRLPLRRRPEAIHTSAGGRLPHGAHPRPHGVPLNGILLYQCNHELVVNPTHRSCRGACELCPDQS